MGAKLGLEMDAPLTRLRIDAMRRWFGGSLAAVLVRTLLAFTVIPLIMMGGAAYLRTRALLRQQVIDQTHNVLTTEIAATEREIRTREIRLDRYVRRGDFAELLDVAFSVDARVAAGLRPELLNKFNELNAEEGTPTFSEFFLLDPAGTVRISSQPDWQGVSLADSAALQIITSEKRSAAILDLQPLYPDELILLTVAEYLGSDSSVKGRVVGVTDSESLQSILQSLVELSPSAQAYFIIPPDAFISREIYTNELSLMNASDSQKNEVLPALDAMMHENIIHPIALEFETAEGRPVLTQVEWIPSMNAGIAVEFEQEQIFGQLDSLIPFTVLLLVASLAVMGLIITVGTNQVIKPLRTLTAITHRFAEGDWSRRAEVPKRENELGLLAKSFNHMADELSGLYRSLEQKVDERTRQVRTAAVVAQNLTALGTLDELLQKTVELLVQEFEFYQSNIFMIDRAGKFAVLRAAHGPAAKDLLERHHRLEVGSASIIGWVCANNKPRIASDVTEDPVHFKNELLPETRAEASVPISIGNLVLGVLDVQSTRAAAFSPETVVMLETLASQIAAAIQNVGLVESTQVNFQELARLYRASHTIAQARDQEQVFEVSGRVLREAPYPIVILAVREEDVEILTLADTPNVVGATVEFQRYLKADLPELQRYLAAGPLIADVRVGESPAVLQSIADRLGFETAAYVPVMRAEHLAAIIVLGAKQQRLTSAAIQPYANLADLISATLDKILASEQTQKRLSELEALSSISQAVSSSGDLQTFYSALHAKVREIIGDYNFTVALYDAKQEMISIPYNFDDNRLVAIEPFPLGEGLTSILVRTGRPLMLLEDAERRAAELGAKVVGRPAQSWMGAPMLLQNRVIGALIVQDLEQERSFTQDNLRFFTALAAQVAGVINNVRLLDESLHRSVQLETAAEIARDISGSLNLDELLAKAVSFIRERFDFYHAAIFLLDLSHEFAVVREATGEAGSQMKRAGHRIGVGSKSIVGYVSGQGEQLVVNDTARDATYYANPLLPETRSEAAIPMKVGDRMLGVLDVQSQHSYAFTEDNLRSLQILADQLAVAVVNTELFAETQEHLSQHRLLHHITTTAASGTTLEEALAGAVTGLQVTMGGDRVSILLSDRTRTELHVQAIVGYSDDVANLRIPFDSGITGWVAAHRRPLRLNNVLEDPRYIQGSPNTRSELAVPLIYRNDLLGVLNVESEQLDAYTENDEEMLGTLGGSLAAIIANARLIEQIRERAERDRLVYEITGKIRRSTDMHSILATTASELTKAVGARQTRIQVSPRRTDSDGNHDS